MLTAQENPTCFGYDGAWGLFTQALEKGWLPHAFLLCGPLGVGKRTFAFRCIRHLLSQGADAADTLFQRETMAAPTTLFPESQAKDGLLSPFRERIFGQVAQNSHPDFFSFADQSIAQTRLLRAFLQKVPSRADAYRCVLIPRVETMMPHAQNALLKSLEEPPPRTVFFMTATQGAGILTTVRSRCQKITLRPLKDTAFQQALDRCISIQGLDDAKKTTEKEVPCFYQHLFQLSLGCLGQALRLLDDADAQTLTTFETVLKHGLLPATHPLYAPPFHTKNQAFWAGLSVDFLYKNFIHHVQGLCIKAATGVMMDEVDTCVTKRLSPEGWARHLESVYTFFSKAHTFNLKAATMAPALFNLGPFAHI